MAGLLTNSERALKRREVSERNLAAMGRIEQLIAQHPLSGTPRSTGSRHRKPASWPFIRKTGIIRR